MTKLIRKVLSLVLILSVMMGFVGCAFFDRIHATMDPKADFISAQEIVRLLVTAIDDPNQLADSYASIPEEQRNDISYSNYFEYITILRSFSDGNGKIKSFRFLDDEENSKHLDSIYNKLASNIEVDDYYTVFSQYGDVRTVEFEYSSETDYPVYMYLDVVDGYAYLSHDLVSQLISTYNYMQQYFNLLEDEKADGISALLSAGNVPVKYADEVLLARANYIIDFYKFRVKNNADQFILVAANPFYVEYNIPEVFSSDGNDIYERNIYAFRNTDGVISITDVFEQETDVNVVTVDVSDTKYLRCGLEYDYSAIVRICGKKPNSMYLKDDVVSVVYDKEGNPIEKKLLLVSYNGMNLTFIVNYTSDENWIGELSSIRLYGSHSDYSVCGIHVGDPEISIIKTFPMITFGEYDIPLNLGNVTYNLSIEVSDSVIKDIYISKVD